MIERLSFTKQLKRTVKRLIYRPSGVVLGLNSCVMRPFHCLSGKYITIGDNTTILPHSFMEAIDTWGEQKFQPHIDIGSGVYIGRNFYATAIREIFIGDLCVFSDHVYITDEFHGMHPDCGPIMEQPLESKGPVIIGRSCFLGYRCAIMPGVTLGDHCVVGANSVVTRSFPAYSMVAGAPAKIIKTFDLKSRVWTCE